MRTLSAGLTQRQQYIHYFRNREFIQTDEAGEYKEDKDDE